MTDEFKNVPVEEGTVVLSKNTVTMLEISACHEVWCWEGITAESVVFRHDDVSHLNDEDIKALVTSNREVVDSGTMTFKRTGEFVFCNFNFIDSDD